MPILSTREKVPEWFGGWRRELGGKDCICIRVDCRPVGRVRADEELRARLELGYRRCALRIQLTVRLGNALKVWLTEISDAHVLAEVMHVLHLQNGGYSQSLMMDLLWVPAMGLMLSVTAVRYNFRICPWRAYFNVSCAPRSTIIKYSCNKTKNTSILHRSGKQDISP